MARADIDVLFEPGPSEYGVRRVSPGDVLRGTVRITPDTDTRCNHLWLRLVWRTEGRGDEDSARAAELDVFQGQLRTGTAGEFPFEFLLPREPWSYAGHYVTIVWSIDVDVDVPWAVNARHRQVFICAPDRGAGAAASDAPTLPAAVEPAAGTLPPEVSIGTATTGGACDLVLTRGGDEPERVVEAIGQIIPGLDPERARQILLVVPFTLLRGVSREEATQAGDALFYAGATVEIKPVAEASAGGGAS